MLIAPRVVADFLLRATTFSMPRHPNHEGRLRIASFIEIVVYIAIAVTFFLNNPDYQFGPPYDNLFPPNVTIAGFLVVISTFTMILIDRAPFIFVLERLLFVSANCIARAEGIVERQDAQFRADDVEDNFTGYIRRSQQAAQVAQRRPNALLFIGTIIALIGLIFFVVTLQGSRFGILLPESGTTTSQAHDLGETLLQLLPRLLMLIFIQVLAGFFLRQYRTSMEDFRYYESVLRHREAQYLSYTLRKRLDDKKSLLKLADDILSDTQIGVLSRSQTTAVLETLRNEENEFAPLYERFADIIASKVRRSHDRNPEQSGKKEPPAHSRGHP